MEKKPMKTIIGFTSPEVYAKVQDRSVNTSAITEALLAQHFGLVETIPTDTTHGQERLAVLGITVPAREVKPEPANIDNLIGAPNVSVADSAPVDQAGATVVGDTPPAPEAANPEPIDELDDTDGLLDDDEEELELPVKPQPQSTDFQDLADPALAPVPAPEPTPPATPPVAEVPFQPITPPTVAPTPVADPAAGIHPVAEPVVEPVVEEVPQYNAGDKVCPNCGKSFNPLPYCINCL